MVEVSSLSLPSPCFLSLLSISLMSLLDSPSRLSLIFFHVCLSLSYSLSHSSVLDLLFLYPPPPHPIFFFCCCFFSGPLLAPFSPFSLTPTLPLLFPSDFSHPHRSIISETYLYFSFEILSSMRGNELFGYVHFNCINFFR